MRSQLTLLCKTPLYWSFKYLGWPKVLPFSYTFSVTYVCPSRCRTCDIWVKGFKTLRREQIEMTLEEWETVFKSLGKSPFWVTLSGGEPSTFKYIVDFVRFATKYNDPKIINIPTNAMLGAKLGDKLREIMAEVSPHTDLILNCSLDHTGERHDFIRGVRNNFGMFEAAWESVKAVQTDYPNLKLGIHTVISSYNADDIPSIYRTVMERFSPDQFITEMAEERYEMNNFSRGITPNPLRYAKAAQFLEAQIEQDFARWSGLNRITQAFRIFYYRFVRRLVLTGREQLPSFAGFATTQIDPLGKVWECAVHASEMGDLRDYNFDFKKLWKSDTANAVRAQVNRSHKCPLANEHYSNMLLNPWVLARVAWKTFMTRRTKTTKDTRDEDTRYTLPASSFAHELAQAKDPLTSRETITLLAAHPEALVRAAVAQHPESDATLLATLATDEDWYVRAKAAERREIAGDLLATLANDAHPTVREHAAKNPNLSAETRETLAQDTDSFVRAAIALRDDANAETLQMLAQDTDWYVRISIAKNAAYTGRVEPLTHDANADVRDVATKRIAKTEAKTTAKPKEEGTANLSGAVL